MADSLLHRWSKQKAQAREETSKPEAEEPVAESEVSESDEEEENQQTEEPDEIELPDLDSLGDDSDYSMFMSSEVDENLKKLALRKLFKAPFFNVMDGLNDYDDDFTTFEALGDIVTSDMKFHQERKKAEQEEREREAAAKEIEEQEEIETLASEETKPEDEPVEPAEQNIHKEEIAQAEQADSTEENEPTAI